MAKSPKVEVSKEDVIALALFAQRSPNAEFRETAFALALSTLADGATPATKLRPLCEFAARTKATGASADRVRAIASRFLSEAGHADLWSQLARSAKQR